MSKDYESLFIVKADLPDAEIDSEVDKVVKLAESDGGSVIELDRWGKKRLAYVIKKQRYGFYALLRFSADSSAPEKLTRHFRLSEKILKGMVVLYDGAAGRKSGTDEEDKPETQTEPETVKKSEESPAQAQANVEQESAGDN